MFLTTGTVGSISIELWRALVLVCLLAVQALYEALQGGDWRRRSEEQKQDGVVPSSRKRSQQLFSFACSIQTVRSSSARLWLFYCNALH